MTTRHYLPLEILLKEKAKEKDKFPDMQIDYFEKYNDLLRGLEQNVYDTINTTLAANSKSKDGAAIYTAHGKDHFDEVVRFAGDLLGINKPNFKQNENINALKPYEIFLLLAAIRVHDTGNMFGREQHEKKCFHILKNIIPLSTTLWSDPEKKIIANIAQAHGGKRNNGDKDVISQLESKRQGTGNDGDFRPQLLASIVRFADEICELRSRASIILLEHDALPRHCQIYHVYAKSIANVKIENDPLCVSIEYQITQNDATKKWGCEKRENDKNEVYLIEEIINRLSKMDQERKYCNIFSRALYSVDSIKAKITITDDQQDIIEEIPVPILNDISYPESSYTKLKKDMERYCSEDFLKKITPKSKD